MDNTDSAVDRTGGAIGITSGVINSTGSATQRTGSAILCRTDGAIYMTGGVINNTESVLQRVLRCSTRTGGASCRTGDALERYGGTPDIGLTVQWTGLTMLSAHIFQLEPPPPEAYTAAHQLPLC